MMKLVYSMDEVSNATGIGKSTLKAMIRAGSLKTFRIGNREKTSAEELDRFVASLSASRKADSETQSNPKRLKFKGPDRWYVTEAEDPQECYVAETPFWHYGVHLFSDGWASVFLWIPTNPELRHLTSYEYIADGLKTRDQAEEKCRNDFAKRVKHCEKMV